MNEAAVNMPIAIKNSAPAEIALFTSPDATLKNGHEAAVALKKMIDSTNSKVRVGGHDHIKVEAWQTVGSFFHVTSKTHAEPFEIDGIKGAKGIAVLVDDITGVVVGGAESYCMRDEEGRGNQPWFKIASMAQTRASSKALANKFKWVTVMAGYSPTPAEEVEAAETNRSTKAATSEEPKVTFQESQLINSINDMLGKMNAGDQDLMARQFQDISKWTDAKTKEEKYVALGDLANIAKRKPLWLVSLHKKVKEEFEKYFDANGNPK